LQQTGGNQIFQRAANTLEQRDVLRAATNLPDARQSLVQIGEDVVIAAQTGISGSSKVGENNMIGGQVGIAGHLVIASNTGIGAQAGIGKSIKEEGSKIIGSPAFDVKEYFKAYAVFKRLPDLVRPSALEYVFSQFLHRIRRIGGIQCLLGQSDLFLAFGILRGCEEHIEEL